MNVHWSLLFTPRHFLGPCPVLNYYTQDEEGQGLCSLPVSQEMPVFGITCRLQHDLLTCSPTVNADGDARSEHQALHARSALLEV